MPDEKLVIALTAEVAKLKSDLAKGQNEVKKFGTGAKDTFKKIGGTLAAAFAVTKVLSFVKTGITEFAKFERSLDNLTGKIERAGQGFDGMRGQMEDYIRTAESATRFSKFQLGASLDNLIGKTGDYTTAIALNEKAMDLAVFANVDLKVAADALALAYEGNTSGVSQMARIMGMATEDAKDLDKVFSELDKRTQDTARSEEGMAVTLDKVNNSLNDAAEVIGRDFGPIIVDTLLPILSAFTSTVSFLSKIIQTLGGSMAEIGARAISLASLLKDVWKGPRTAWKAYQAEQAQISRDTADEIERIWQKSADKKNQIDLKAVRDGFKLKKKEVDQTKETESAKVDTIAEAAETTKTIREELILYIEEQNAATVALFEMDVETIKALATAMAKSMSDAATKWFVAVKKGTATTKEAIKEMGKAMFKTVVNMFGEMMIAEGARYIARGVAALASVIGAAAAPGLFIAGAGLTAAGGVVKGMSLTLAEGGLVTEPSMALIGEAGPEVVVPLDKLGAMTSSIDLRHSTWTMIFPGVKNIGDLKGKRFAESAERQMARVFDGMLSRSGEGEI